MPGWTVHSYSTVPALSTLVVNVLPLPNSSDLNVAPDLATASWSTVSSLIQQIVWPVFAVALSGANLMSFMWIVTASLAHVSLAAGWLALSSPPPQAAKAMASRAMISRRIMA